MLLMPLSACFIAKCLVPLFGLVLNENMKHADFDINSLLMNRVLINSEFFFCFFVFLVVREFQLCCKMREKNRAHRR